MALLDGVAWEGKVFKGGTWADGRGGTYAVVEPATGKELGTMGQADAEDVAEAAASAAEAQKEWAALPHTARAAVLRRAGDLWAEHADEIRDWNVREVGAIPPMADFAMHVAAEECYQASSLPGQPIGQLLPSEQPRLSMARQLPAGVVAVISPFNVPIISQSTASGVTTRSLTSLQLPFSSAAMRSPTAPSGLSEPAPPPEPQAATSSSAAMATRSLMGSVSPIGHAQRSKTLPTTVESRQHPRAAVGDREGVLEVRCP